MSSSSQRNSTLARRASRPAEGLLAAGRSPGRGAVNANPVRRRIRRRPHPGEQPVAVSQDAVCLRPHEEIGTTPVAMLGEECRDVTLAVHHRHRADPSSPRPDGVSLSGQGGAVSPSPQPARRFPLLRRLFRLPGTVGAVELNARHPERDALSADGESAVHMDAEGARSLPAAVFRYYAQSLASLVGREIEVGAVLNQQHRPGAAHTPHRPLPCDPPESPLASSRHARGPLS